MRPTCRRPNRMTSFVLALSATLPPAAFAQQVDVEPAAEDLAEVVVTGSRIQRRDASAVGPLTTLTAEDIALAAPTSAGDLLQALPSVGVSLNSNGTQGTSFGVSSINLRYLGSAEGSVVTGWSPGTGPGRRRPGRCR